MVLAPATGIFYLREATGWRSYTSQTAAKCKSCDTSYRRQAQVENSPEWEIIASI